MSRPGNLAYDLCIRARTLEIHAAAFERATRKGVATGKDRERVVKDCLDIISLAHAVSKSVGEGSVE